MKLKRSNKASIIKLTINLINNQRNLNHKFKFYIIKL